MLVQHKDKIIVIRGKETIVQKTYSYKELVELLNNTSEARRVAIVCQLPSSNLIITIEDEQAIGMCTKES